jgi:hypothetical protein
LILLLSATQSCAESSFSVQKFFNSDSIAIKRVLNSQVKFANKYDFNKFISTYDAGYLNSDGMDLEVYSKLIKDVWETYNNIKYDIKIQDITV